MDISNPSSFGGNRDAVSVLTRFTDAPLVHVAVLAQARCTPDSVAVEGVEGCLTYAQLEHVVLLLAQYLRLLGGGPEKRIGFHLHPSIDSVVAQLGKRGGRGA